MRTVRQSCEFPLRSLKELVCCLQCGYVTTDSRSIGTSFRRKKDFWGLMMADERELSFFPPHFGNEKADWNWVSVQSDLQISEVFLRNWRQCEAYWRFPKSTTPWTKLYNRMSRKKKCSCFSLWILNTRQPGGMDESGFDQAHVREEFWLTAVKSFIQIKDFQNRP